MGCGIVVEVAIIGGGVCGCSLLYALSRYNARVMLLEATNDVGVATTKANSAIVHAGYDPEPGTLMARYNVAGSAMIRRLAGQLDILYRPCGSLVIGFDEADRRQLELLYARGQKNRVEAMELLDAPALGKLEPRLSEAACCALHAPGAAVVNPWELAYAQAEVAVQNGAELLLEAGVRAIELVENKGGVAGNGPMKRHFLLHTARGPVEARTVVNCAGIHSAAVAAMASPSGRAGFAIHTSRGEYYLLDKSAGDTVGRVVFQCPTPLGKGVLVAPTVHGNLIVGPNAEAAASLATTAEGLAQVRRQALRSVPGLDFSAAIRNFAGLRAQASLGDMADTGDFVIGESDEVPGFFNVAGIKSPGLSAAPAIAAAVVEQLGEKYIDLKENKSFNNSRKILRFSHLDDAAREKAIAGNPLYGRIVCRCETVTEGEIVDALHRPLPPRSLDAVKRRCGPGMGRCQGGFCGARVQAIIARELGISPARVPQDRSGMNIVTGRTKAGPQTGEGGAG